MYVVNGKYVVRSNLDNTILINIENNDESLFLDGVAKLIIDNISLECKEIVLLLKEFFPNEKTERLKKDYHSFIEQLLDEGILIYVK